MYEKLNFRTGQVLAADDLNHMEEGIAAAMNAGGIVAITWSELRKLRNEKGLKAGSFYRITDYVTTTAQANTKSAGHQFDVVVLALSNNVLAEKAYAALHEGDTYFSEAGANLAAWQIWYCLDNDAERFAWADVQNGKGVIYRMIDEWNNDLPYDFKNIIYVENPTFECSLYGKDHTYTKNGDVLNIDAVNYYGYIRTRTGQGPPPPPEVLYITDEMPTTNSIIYTIEGSVATPYTSATIDSVNQKSGDYYTFHANGKDASAHKIHICYNNIIRAYYENDVQQRLNKIVFAEQFDSQFICYGNTFGNSCHSNSFGNSCHSNSFGDGCHSNSFGFDCFSNTFGYNCHSNTFGYNCHGNTFGYECHSGTFGDDCFSNTFGYNCHSNTFGDGCFSNTFGNNCHSNTFGNNCYGNTFGYECHSGTFGDDCNYNMFGNSCRGVKLSENTTYQTASVNSNSEVKVFNLADLLNL